MGRLPVSACVCGYLCGVGSVSLGYNIIMQSFISENNPIVVAVLLKRKKSLTKVILYYLEHVSYVM